MVPVLSVVGCAGHSILALLVCQPQVLKQSGPGSEPEVSCESPGWVPLLKVLSLLIPARHWLQDPGEAQADAFLLLWLYSLRL